MKVQFVGDGVLVTHGPKGFGAVGRGAVVEIDDGRAELLLKIGTVARVRQGPPSEMEITSPAEIVDPEELKLVGTIFGEAHARVVAGIEANRARGPEVKA